MLFTIVKVDTCGDGVSGLYLDGKLVTYGDPYHNDIETYISAYIDGVRSVQPDITIERRSYDNRRNIAKYCENGHSFPSNLSDFKGTPNPPE